MHFTHKKFEEAYWAIINEDAEVTANETPETSEMLYITADGKYMIDDKEVEVIKDPAEVDIDPSQLEEGSVIVKVDDEVKVFGPDQIQQVEEECSEIEECGDGNCEQIDEDEDSEDPEDSDEEGDEEEPVTEEAEEVEETEEDEDAEAEEDDEDSEKPAEGEGKFISFYTTNPDLIKALSEAADQISKIVITVGEDKDTEELEFTIDDLENLAVEDLEDVKAAEDEGDEEDADTDKVEADADMAAAEADMEAEAEAKAEEAEDK